MEQSHWPRRPSFYWVSRKKAFHRHFRCWWKTIRFGADAFKFTQLIIIYQHCRECMAFPFLFLKIRIAFALLNKHSSLKPENLHNCWTDHREGTIESNWTQLEKGPHSDSMNHLQIWSCFFGWQLDPEQCNQSNIGFVASPKSHLQSKSWSGSSENNHECLLNSMSKPTGSSQ